MYCTGGTPGSPDLGLLAVHLSKSETWGDQAFLVVTQRFWKTEHLAEHVKALF